LSRADYACRGTTFSAPSIAVRSSGEADIVAEGASNSLMYYYAWPGTAWSRAQIAGSGTTFSAPSIAVRSSGEADIVAEGASNSLMYYYAWPGTAWSRAQIAGSGFITGTTFSAPSIAVRSTGEADIVAEGPNNSLMYYFAFPGTAWTSVDLNGSFHPTAGAAYSPVNGPLFGPGGPSYLDVQQGGEGDCWLLASLAEVAARDPADITSMFTYDGATVENGSVVGVYTVRFYNSRGGATYVTVDTELPAGGGYYDRVPTALGSNNLWVALAEKAYAEANGDGFVTTNHVGIDSYDALNNGDPAWALQAITGKPASDYSINPSNIATAWNQGKFIVLGTPVTPTSSYIVGHHAYAVVGYNPSSSDPYEVFNPWGTDANGWAPGHANTTYGLFYANAAFLSQNFSYQSLTSAAAGMTPGQVKTELPIAPGAVGQAHASDAIFSSIGGQSQGSLTGSSNPDGPPHNRIADMLALRRADAAAQSLADGAASVLAMHRRINALDAFYADSGS
jgi:hypothetical protein